MRRAAWIIVGLLGAAWAAGVARADEITFTKIADTTTDIPNPNGPGNFETFGVRTEVNVFRGEHEALVTGPRQQEVVTLLP